MKKTRIINYRFDFPDDRKIEFEIDLSLPLLSLNPHPTPDETGWTKLEYMQCPNCPLEPSDCPKCPVAANLTSVIDTFQDCVSYLEVVTTVQTDLREYRKKAPLQVGLSSLVGLIMATSGCPILDKLRPMAYSHLPFSDSNETTLRAISSHLLVQCIRQKQGQEPDWNLDNLIATYEDVRVVNKAFAERIRKMCGKDASINAMVMLDTFASLATFALAKRWWKDIEPLFAPSQMQTAGTGADS